MIFFHLNDQIVRQGHRPVFITLSETLRLLTSVNCGSHSEGNPVDPNPGPNLEENSVDPNCGSHVEEIPVDPNPGSHLEEIPVDPNCGSHFQ